ncbi:MAG: SpvB/TcaC N-terminal domain-containing protein [Dehalococcoidia bacterium]
MGRTRHPASPRRGLRSLAIGLITLATLLPGTASIAGADEDEDDPFVEPPQGTIEGVTDPTGQSSSAPPIVQEPAPAPDVAYPAPEGAKVPVAANATRAGRSPIAIRQTPEEPTAAPAEVDVEILGRDTAQKAGGQVLAFTVTPAALAPGRTDAPLTIEIDYSGFERAYGGDWTERVQLVQLPRCALVTPDQAKCRERTVVPLKRDYARKTWVADVDLEKSIESGGPGPREQVAGGGGVTFALTSGISGNTGTFGATSLSPSASWSVGANSGTFSWSRSLRVPPGTGGFTPEISINYSSGRLDGMTQTTNNQTSQLGLGWDISMNMFIERRYLSCRNDNDFSTYADDLCWIDHNATLYMNGGAQELVRQGVSNTWRLRSDPTWRVELLTGASNGALNGEYWRVTTTDGTQYFFGQDDANITGTRQSAWVVPVHGNAVGEPCNGGICMMGWRWMVNRIQDPRGNYVDVSWEAEWNRYAQTGNTVSTSGGWYVRGGFLSKVEYGRNVNIAPGTPWPQWIFFETSYRCITFDNDCVNHLDPDVDGPHWPDVPLDLRCPDGVTCNDLSPSFFSLRRLSVIDTQYWDNATGQHRHVTNYRLFHDFVDTDPIIDFSRMWLRWFQEQGRDPNDPNPAAGIWLPATRFDNFLVGQPDLTAHLPNRADTAGGTVPSLNLPRVSVIRDDIGKMTAIKYGQTFPCPPYYTGIWDQNLSDCFPQQVINAGTSGFGVFNKWLVQSVEERDSTTASSPSVLTTYSYEGTPAWHFSDDPIVANSQETWADWRGYLAVLVRKGSGRHSALVALLETRCPRA